MTPDEAALTFLGATTDALDAIDLCVSNANTVSLGRDQIRRGAEALAKAAADPVYDERARVLALATKALQALGVRCGLGRHPDSDEAWDAEWRTIVFVDLPTGQASWHLHDSQVKYFAHLKPYEGPWDGHSTVEKYSRLEAFSKSMVPFCPDCIAHARSAAVIPSK